MTLAVDNRKSITLGLFMLRKGSATVYPAIGPVGVGVWRDGWEQKGKEEWLWWGVMQRGVMGEVMGWMCRGGVRERCM
jgi:hypothetical protein